MEQNDQVVPPKVSISVKLIGVLTFLTFVTPLINVKFGVSELVTIIQISFYGAVGVSADILNFKHTKSLLGKE